MSATKVKEGDEGIIDLQIQLNAIEDGKGVPQFNVEGVGNIDKQNGEGNEEGDNSGDQGNETAREGDLDQINEQPGEEGEQKQDGEGDEEELNQDILNENSQINSQNDAD